MRNSGDRQLLRRVAEEMDGVTVTVKLYVSLYVDSYKITQRRKHRTVLSLTITLTKRGKF